MANPLIIAVRVAVPDGETMQEAKSLVNTAGNALVQRVGITTPVRGRDCLFKRDLLVVSRVHVRERIGSGS